MKKENFVRIINAIIEQDKIETKFSASLDPFFSSPICLDITSNFIQKIIESLIDEMGDDISGSIIDWWLYDAPRAGENKKSAWIKEAALTMN